VKVIEIDEANIKECVKEAQSERVVLTRRGKPIAVIAGVEGMDLEQITLGHSDEFWQLIRERRKQMAISRTELEKRLTKP
jgi:prevent-host-death family protein